MILLVQSANRNKRNVHPQTGKILVEEIEPLRIPDDDDYDNDDEDEE